MLQCTSCIIKASCQSQTTWNAAASSNTGPCPYPCQSKGNQDKIWLRGTQGQTKMLSVIAFLTNFLKLPQINKEPVGVAAQGKPQAFFQLVSPERQIGILHSTLREESGNKWRGCVWEEDVKGYGWRAHCKGKERVWGGRPREDP